MAVATSPLVACSDEGDSTAFCERVADVPQVGEILAEIDVTDPGASRRRLRDGAAEFRALEADAPGQIRSDLARLRQGVELVIEAIEENPDDLSAARQAIAAREDELAGLASAGERVADYADRECDIDLVPPSTVGSGPDPTDPIDPPATETSEPGSDGTDPDATTSPDPDPTSTDPDPTTSPDATTSPSPDATTSPDPAQPDDTTGTSLDGEGG